MNSLVVLFSVVAFAAAKPSGLLDTVAYSAPIIAAAPAAVSSQSRVDIKSSPAVLTTSAYSPISSIIAQPTLLSAPTVFAAPSAVSSQSRIDIKSSPAVTTSVISAAPVAYSTSGLVKTALAAPAISAYSTPAIATSGIVSPAIATTSYAAPALSAYAAPAISAYAAPALSAYAAPAISAFAGPAISTYAAPTLTKTASIAAPSVPLDTPEVLAARAAHLETQWLADAHLIRKRSVVGTPLLTTHIATPIVSTYTSSIPVVSTYAAGHLAYSSPLVAKSYGLRAW